MKTPDNNSIDFEDVTLDEARKAGSPADASKRNFDITQTNKGGLESSQDIELKSKVAASTSFDELAIVFGELPKYIETSQGKQSIMDVVVNPVVQFRAFYTQLAKEKQPRPEVGIIKNMLLDVTRTYHIRDKVEELITKELDTLFSK